MEKYWSNSSHEKNTFHLDNFQTWKELDVRISKEKTINNINQQNIKEKEQYWRQIFERLIALIRILATQNLTFRGTNEKLYNNNGNFLKLVEYLALFDPVMNEYLRSKIKKLWFIIWEKIFKMNLCRSLSEKNKILSLVKSAKYYLIILHTRRHIEQMTMIIRFVDIIKPLDSEFNPAVIIREHFLGFVRLDETTGAFIRETSIKKLDQMEL